MKYFDYYAPVGLNKSKYYVVTHNSIQTYQKKGILSAFSKASLTCTIKISSDTEISKIHAPSNGQGFCDIDGVTYYVGNGISDFIDAIRNAM